MLWRGSVQVGGCALSGALARLRCEIKTEFNREIKITVGRETEGVPKVGASGERIPGRDSLAVV